MKKRVKLISMIMLLSLSIMVGCSNETAEKVESVDGAPDWPKKTIEVVVPYGAGGDTDFNARAYTKRLSDKLGVSVVVTNMTGSGGSIATREVKNSDPDGYKILLANSALHANEASGLTDFSWDEALEIVAIGARHSGDLIFVSGDSPYDSLEDLIEGSKQNPGELLFGGDIGATTNVIGAMINKAGGDLTIVSSGGAGDRLTGLIGGHVDVVPNPYGTMRDYLETGEVKAIALVEEERNPYFEIDVPTAVEQGYDVLMPKVFFFAAPKGTPQEVIDVLANALEEISLEDEYLEEIKEAYYQERFFLKGEEAAKYMDDQREMFMGYQDALK